MASELLRKVIDELKSRGVKELRLSDRPSWHFWPGIDLRYEDGLDLLTKFNFEKDRETVDYIYDIKEFSYPHRISRLKERLEREGTGFKIANRADRQRLAKWVAVNFPCPSGPTKLVWLL